MASIFGTDPPPKDTTADALRQQEQQRAEQSRTSATQDQLTQETLMRSRKFGTRSLLGAFGSGGSLLGSG